MINAVGSLGTAVTKAQLDHAAKWTHSSIVNVPVKSTNERGDENGTVTGGGRGSVKSTNGRGDSPVKSKSPPALVLLMDDDKAGVAAVQRLATKLLPEWCLHQGQGQVKHTFLNII